MNILSILHGMNELKQELHSNCIAYIEQSIREIESVIADRREAMLLETKSSMGDKYETAREMMQQDINLNQQRLANTQADLAVLRQMNPMSVHTTIGLGSIVLTNNGAYFLAVSARSFIISGTKYLAISPTSPIGHQLRGKVKGDTFSFNGRYYLITDVL